MDIEHPNTNLMLAGVPCGCASVPPFVDVTQPKAADAATRRAPSELKGPSINSAPIRETSEPISIRFDVLRAEHTQHTLSATGCGQRAPFAAPGPDNGLGCFAHAWRTEMQ